MSLNTQIINPYEMSDYDAVVIDIYQARNLKENKNLDAITFFSELFLNKPYLLGALGEGVTALFDQNPLYRTDAFDCVTLVNTVLALAISHHLQDFKKNIVAVNYYDSDPVYHKRFHFMSVDWNIQNNCHGYVEDVTKKIVNRSGKSIYHMAKTMIDRPNWFQYRTLADIKLVNKASEGEAKILLNQLHQLASTVKSDRSELPYLPLTELFHRDQPREDLFDQIPHGCLVEIVRPNWNLRDKIGTNLDVSHVGLVLRLKGELIFRQASLLKKYVSDVSLIQYLRENGLSEKSIGGINIQAFNNF